MEKIVIKEMETADPAEHARNIRKGLQGMADHLRKDIEKVNDPQAKALFETSAEVLLGLTKAFAHYEEKSEAAWR
ncbi:MAG: hypothetical protein WD604_04560 [Balneolaceae bacterium]